MNNMIMIFCLMLFCSSVSFALTPRLSPNEKYRAVGIEGARKDYRLCREIAKERSGTGRRVASGAATGATYDVLTGSNFGYDLVFAAAAGAVVGAASSDNSDEIVGECLREKGYQISGWD